VGTTENGKLTLTLTPTSRVTTVVTSATPPVSNRASTLSWDPAKLPAGTASVRLHRDGVLVATSSDPASGFLIDATPTTAARYVLIPVTSTGPGAPVAVTVSATPAPAAVAPAAAGCANFGSITYASGAYTVAWQPVAATPRVPVTGYRLYNAASASASWSGLTPVYDGPLTSFAHVTAAPGAYRVSAYGPGGESPLSAAQCPSAPGPVSGLRAVSGDASAVVSWSAHAGSSTYLVEVLNPAGVAVATRTVSATTTTFTGLVNGTTYTIRVTPESGLSATVVLEVGANVTPRGVLYALATANGTRAWSNPSSTGAVTMTSLTGYPSLPLTNATDRSFSTVAASANGGANYFQVDFGAYTKVVPSAFFVVWGNPSSTTYIRGSVDGVTWTDLYKYPINVGTDVTTKDTVDVTSSTAYRYFRFHRESSAPGWFGLNEFEVFGTVVPVTHSGYAASVVASGPTAYYQLSEATPTGDSASSRTATASAVTFSGTGPRGGKAATFNGTSSYVSLPGTFGGTASASVEAWYKTDGPTSDFQTVIASSALSFFHVQAHTAGNNIVYAGSAATLPPAPAAANGWHHVVVTSAPGRQVMYVDGVEVGSASASGGVSASSSVSIGRGFSNGRFFKGQIADVAVYDKALSAAEVLTHFKAS
jgi:hypothetical protein